MPLPPAASAPQSAAAVPTRVWDLPTRLFHWLLAASLVASVVSAKIGGNAMVWHFRFGLFALGLLTFRILWGFVGGRWSRFASFVYAPATVLRYLRGHRRQGELVEVGHSPIGALSVFALLAVLCVQVATGLVSDDEIASVGPLNRFVSTATGIAANGWHKTWGQWLIFGLVGLHVAAILFYRFGRKTDLIGPMLYGDKALPPGTPPSADSGRQRLLAAVLAAACVALVWWVSGLGD